MYLILSGSDITEIRLDSFQNSLDNLGAVLHFGIFIDC